jgi:hypothetical protein
MCQSRSEGLLWHVMVTPIKINASLLTKYLEAVGDRMCDPSPAVMQELAKADKYFKAPPVNRGDKSSSIGSWCGVLCFCFAQCACHWLPKRAMFPKCNIQNVGGIMYARGTLCHVGYCHKNGANMATAGCGSSSLRTPSCRQQLFTACQQHVHQLGSTE